MINDSDKVREWAALHAAGALEGAEARAFADLLAQRPDVRRELASFGVVVEAAAESVPAVAPPAALKERILEAAERAEAGAGLEAHLKQLLPPATAGMGFLKRSANAAWLPLRVPGAFVKLLSFDSNNAYAVVLGKLEPGARYPAHQHIHPEDIYMLEGDLHVGDEVLHEGDFHHAGAATHHGVNWSENGCVLLAVLSKDDLLLQFAAV